MEGDDTLQVPDGDLRGVQTLDVETTRFVKDAIRGEIHGVSWIIRRFTPLLRAQARFRLGSSFANATSIDDILQEAWLIMIPRLGLLKPQNGRLTPVLLAFLSRVICGIASNKIRSNLRARVQSSAECLPENQEASRPNPEAEQIRSVVSQVATHELHDQLTMSLELLSEKDREVIVLRGIEGLSNTEAAAELQESPNTVAQRYRRALAALRVRLPKSIYEDLVDV